MTQSMSSCSIEALVVTTRNRDEVVGIDVQRHRGNEWFFDDFPCAGPCLGISEQDKRMAEWAISCKSVVVKDITHHVYFLDVTDINAPVKYATALRRLPLLTRVAFPVVPLKRKHVHRHKLTFDVTYGAGGLVV
jgi:hypothetical protein